MMIMIFIFVRQNNYDLLVRSNRSEFREGSNDRRGSTVCGSRAKSFERVRSSFGKKNSYICGIVAIYRGDSSSWNYADGT